MPEHPEQESTQKEVSPPTPHLGVVSLKSGRKTCENGTYIGIKKILEETHVSCFPFQLGPFGTDKEVSGA